MPRDGLLADARDHLRDVDKGALGAAQRHGERSVRLVQRGQRTFARLVIGVAVKKCVLKIPCNSLN